MIMKDPAGAWRAKTLRAWQLAILRFAVTLDDADRLAVMAAASELDRLGPQHDGGSDFGFFRKTSQELCFAILRPNELSTALLRQFLARIDDDRLKQMFAAAVEAGQAKETAVRKPFKRHEGLWRGLSSQGNRSL
jgi:alkyl sulfatase BDS1-like metallo-beta-lactamase superfamily hydrolase